MKLAIFTYCTLLCYKSSLAANARIDPLVLIDQGLVKGQRASDGHYASFLGIPYAKVDVENPFGASIAHPGFGGEVFDANDGSISCPQTDTTAGTLDCLRLNIYTPDQADSKHLLPVLVYIHGGGYQFGSAGLTEGPNIVNQGIVLVTINYRLGPYGFLCLNVPTVPGNQGLKDQLAALRWIKDNIAAFGGDPYDVTISGQSAGGASVVYHMYSPQEKLFNKAIIQSGIPQTPGLFVNANDGPAIKLSEHLGFSTNDTNQALEFLSKASPNLVMAAQVELGFELPPCKEQSFSGIENFITDDPITMSNPSKISGTPILIGATSNEFYGQTIEMENIFYENIKSSFNLEEYDLQRTSNFIKHFYLGDEKITNDVLPEIVYFYSDFMWYHPNERTIAKFLDENSGPIYQYVFNFASENDEGTENNVPHSGEIKYLFASAYDSFNAEEKLVSDHVTSIWANFVKYGNPTPVGNDLVGVTWLPASADSRPYMMITTELQLEHRFRGQSMAFWDLFYHIYGKYNNVGRHCGF